MPERPKGAVCKTAGYAFGGSNPPPPIQAVLSMVSAISACANHRSLIRPRPLETVGGAAWRPGRPGSSPALWVFDWRQLHREGPLRDPDGSRLGLGQDEGPSFNEFPAATPGEPSEVALSGAQDRGELDSKVLRGVDDEVASRPPPECRQSLAEQEHGVLELIPQQSFRDPASVSSIQLPCEELQARGDEPAHDDTEEPKDGSSHGATLCAAQARRTAFELGSGMRRVRGRAASPDCWGRVALHGLGAKRDEGDDP